MQLRRDPSFYLLLTSSLAWLGLVFLAPWASRRGLGFDATLYFCFGRVCHQIPERSYHLWGHPLAVCHRCLGLYMGFAFGLAVLGYAQGLREHLLARPRMALAFFAPMGIDVMLRGWNVPTSRFVTGFLAALPVGLFVWAALSQLYQRTRRSTEAKPKREESGRS